MRTRYLLGILAVFILILAVWLVPMALASANDSTAPNGQSSPVPSQGSGSQCPYLQAHPWLDPHNGDGDPSSPTGASYQVMYY
jgi:hypothetical protein